MTSDETNDSPIESERRRVVNLMDAMLVISELVSKRDKHTAEYANGYRAGVKAARDMVTFDFIVASGFRVNDE